MPEVDDLTDVANRVVDAFRTGVQIEEHVWRDPPNVLQAYEIQSCVMRKLGFQQVGWKLGSTSGPAQTRRHISEPVYGLLSKERMFRSGETIRRDLFIDPHLEVEILFEIGDDLLATTDPHGEDAIWSKISRACLAIEIADGRLKHWRTCHGFSGIADNVGHGAFVIGPEVSVVSPEEFRAVQTELLVGSVVSAQGVGSAVLGNPLRGVGWLANTLEKQGKVLRRGDLVLSGTTSGIVPLGSSSSITANCAGASVSAELV